LEAPVSANSITVEATSASLQAAIDASTAKSDQQIFRIKSRQAVVLVEEVGRPVATVAETEKPLRRPKAA
jgi:hypothetical protein